MHPNVFPGTITGYDFSAERVEVPALAAFSRNITPEKAEDIARIDAEILRNDDVIITSLNRRAALHRMRNSFLPAIDLPREILEMIFELACYYPSEEKSLFFAALKLDERLVPTPGTPQDRIDPRPVTPLFIGSVCSAWRGIVLGASQLWNNIKITVNETHADTQSEILNYWIFHSGQRPITVKLVENEKEAEDITSTAVIDALVKHASQLHTLDLILPVAWESAVSRIAKCVDQLIFLKLRKAYASDSLGRVNLFENAPKLRELTLFDYSIADVSFPWAQIEHLTFPMPTKMAECLAALRLCPRLRSAMFHLQNSGDALMDLTPITHNSLEVLEAISPDRDENLLELLDLLALPSLRSFSSWTDQSSTPALFPLITRSACKLETLCLAGYTYMNELTDCLCVSPRLRKLVLYELAGPENGYLLTQGLLDLMNPRKYSTPAKDGPSHSHWNRNSDTTRVYEEGSDKCLCPNLETFFFHGDIVDCYDGLVEFVVDRWNSPFIDLEIQPSQDKTQTVSKNLRPTDSPVVRLRSATIEVYELKINKKYAPILRKLREEGMHVEIPDDRTWGPWYLRHNYDSE